MVVERIHPFKGRQFQCLLGFPGCMTVDQFGLLYPIDRLGQGFVVAVATVAHRGLYACLRKAFGAENGNILRPPI